MAKVTNTVSVLPSPKRLIEALRDVGYDFASAVADLVDNCIAADASRVDIQVHWDGPASWVRIADDGTGMDAATVTEALRFGSERTYKADDLGKFGLGLKTASLSQCRSILVASRTSPEVARIEARRFDLDRILRDNRWEVEVLAAADRPLDLVEPLKAHRGTVVLWTGLDRLLGFQNPHGERAKSAFWQLVERLEQHLGMVFHRFIEGSTRGRPRRGLVISINGNRVEPWNPFAPDEDATVHLGESDYEIAAGGASGIVAFDPWVLPAKDKFSTELEFNRLSGPLKWNQQQGLYIYRANRMIQSGGWSRLRAPDEHTKLARAALDFYPELDGAFGINIAKMRVNLPPQLREQLKDPLDRLIREAKSAYSSGPRSSASARSGARRQASAAVAPKEKPSPAKAAAAASPAGGDEEPSAFPWPPPTLRRPDRFREALTASANKVGQLEALECVVSQLKEDDPEVARDLGW